ncbi:MAG: hypothetical protein ACK4UN_01970 [Limisphaerales bacterium]
MKSSIITGIMAVTILIAGCGKETASSSVTLPTPQDATSPPPAAQQPERAIVTKARGIVLPEFKLDRATLTEAIKQLQSASAQNDPENQGVNFMIINPADAGAVPEITLDLKNITLEEATKRLAEAAGISVSARDYAFVFDPKSDQP